MTQDLNFSIIPTDPNPDISPEDQERLMNTTYALVAYGMAKGVEPADAVGLPSELIDAFHALAVRHYEGRRFDSAALLYQRLLQLKPLQLVFYKGLGACCLGLQRYDAAIQAYSNGMAFGPLDAELHYYLGQAYYFDKQFEPAFDMMRFARVLDEQDPASQGKIAGFATQMLDRLKLLVSPDKAALIDLRPD